MASTQCVCDKCNVTVPVDLNFRGDNVQFVGCNTTANCPNCGNPLVIPDGSYASNLYGEYLKELANTYQSALAKIRTQNNFEYGDEFEVAICEALRLILPAQYGVCRGYLVDSSGNKSGDDIIVYDRVRFPTIRLEAEEKYERLQQIPIEAAYLYIEAKHTLYLDGSGGQSLAKSIKQVSDVKALTSKRTPVQATPSRTSEAHRVPEIRNPMMGIILARYVKKHSSGEPLTKTEIAEFFVGNRASAHDSEGPDIIVPGPDVIVLPFWNRPGDRYELRLPFVQDGTSMLPHMTDGVSFGVAVSAILFAMEWVILGPMPWVSIIADGLGIRRTAKV